MVYELQFDGLFRRIGDNTKTGVMAYGWLIFRQDLMVARGYGAVAGRAEATSNVAEYLALIEGLRALLDMGIQNEQILVSGDSKIVISQMNGTATIHAERMQELYAQAADLATQFIHINYEWRKRSKNKAADQLTRHAIKQARKNRGDYEQIVQDLAACGGKVRRRSRRLTDSFLPLVDLSVFHPQGLAVFQ
jgi:ribonuclease HI